MGSARKTVAAAEQDGVDCRIRGTMLCVFYETIYQALWFYSAPESQDSFLPSTSSRSDWTETMRRVRYRKVKECKFPMNQKGPLSSGESIPKTDIAPNRKISYTTCSGYASKTHFAKRSTDVRGGNNGIAPPGIPKREVGLPFSRRFVLS